MNPVTAFLAIDMDNFSAFEQAVDVASRLKQAIEYIERYQAWQITAGRLSMNQATAATLSAAAVMGDLKKLCEAHRIEIKTFPHNQKEIVDHDLLTEIGHRVGTREFQHVAVITNDAKAFTVPIEHFPKTRFFMVISDSEIGDNVRAKFTSYPNVDVFTFGFGKLDNLHRRRQPNQSSSIRQRVINVEVSPPQKEVQDTWPGVIPEPVQDFLTKLINVCQICGFRTLWSPNESVCDHCGGGLKLNHLYCRPSGRNPLHPHRFFAIYEPGKLNQVAGMVILPSHMQWQVGDSVMLGRYDVTQATMIPVDDWLVWLTDSEKKFLAREQLSVGPDPDTPLAEQGHICWTKKENVTLERSKQSLPLAPGAVTPLNLGDYLHVGTKQHPLFVLHYLGRLKPRPTTLTQ